MRTTIQQVRDEATRLGAELDENSPVDYGAFAPPGFLFVDSDCHTLVVSAEGEPDVTPAQVRRDMLAALKLGLAPCTDATCDYCTAEN